MTKYQLAIIMQTYVWLDIIIYAAASRPGAGTRKRRHAGDICVTAGRSAGGQPNVGMTDYTFTLMMSYGSGIVP